MKKIFLLLLLICSFFMVSSVFRDLKNIGYDYTFKTIYTGRKITDLIFCLKEEGA